MCASTFLRLLAVRIGSWKNRQNLAVELRSPAAVLEGLASPWNRCRQVLSQHIACLLVWDALQAKKIAGAINLPVPAVAIPRLAVGTIRSNTECLGLLVQQYEQVARPIWGCRSHVRMDCFRWARAWPSPHCAETGLLLVAITQGRGGAPLAAKEYQRRPCSRRRPQSAAQQQRGRRAQQQQRRLRARRPALRPHSRQRPKAQGRPWQRGQRQRDRCRQGRCGACLLQPASHVRQKNAAV